MNTVNNDEALLGSLYEEIEEHLSSIERASGIVETAYMKVDLETNESYVEFTFEDGQEPVLLYPREFKFMEAYGYQERYTGKAVTFLVGPGRRFEAIWGADESIPA